MTITAERTLDMLKYVACILVFSVIACDVGADPVTGERVSEVTAGGFTINPATGWPDAGSIWTRGANSVSGTGAWNVALSLPVGSMVPTIAANVVDNSTSVVDMMLVSYVGSGFSVIAQVNSASIGAQTLSLPSAHVVTSSESLVLRFTTPGSSTAPTVGLIGIGTAPTPLRPSAYLTIPSQYFTQDGVNTLVSQLDLTVGTKVSDVSIAAHCAYQGFIIACARIREIGTWDWCSRAVACDASASAGVSLDPITVDALRHVDIGLMSGPSQAGVAVGVVTLN